MSSVGIRNSPWSPTIRAAASFKSIPAVLTWRGLTLLPRLMVWTAGPRRKSLWVDAPGYISPMAAHDHDHNEGSNLSEMELRVRALETILVEKGYAETAALDRIVELYESKIGPHLGAQVIDGKRLDNSQDGR
jgi:hypothetical protein